MKKIIFIFCLLGFTISCKKDKKNPADYKQEMRNLVQHISSYARSIKPGFIVIPQNGHQLLTSNGLADGALSSLYIQTIDGIGREDLFYGYENDNKATSSEAKDEMLPFLDIAK